MTNTSDYIGKRFHIENKNTKTIMWDLMGPCNFNCSYCAANYNEQKDLIKPLPDNYSMDNLKKVYKKNFDDCFMVHQIVATGEPTLHPMFRDLMSFLLNEESSKYIRVFSNLTRDKDYWLSLVSEKLLSLLSSSRVNHQLKKLIIFASYHPEFTKEKEYMENYYGLRELVGNIYGTIVITKKDFNTIFDKIDYLHNHYPDYFFYIAPDFRGTVSNTEFTFDEDQMRRINDFNFCMSAHHKDTYDNLFRICNDELIGISSSSYLQQNTKNMLCGCGSHLITIHTTTGTVSNCNGRIMSCYEKIYEEYGNIYTDDQINLRNILPKLCKEETCCYDCYSLEIPKFSIPYYKNYKKK